MINFLHTGDIHLDSPLKGLSAEMSVLRREEMLSTFISMMEFATAEKLDIVFISGDLFDSGFVSKKTISAVSDAFAAVPCPIVISPGNHDPYRQSSGIYSIHKFSDNVHLFKADSTDFFEFENIGARVYGYAFNSEELRVNPLIQTPLHLEDSYINFLCAHADILSPLSPYAPISEANIAEIGFDYAALGHIHKYPDMRTVGNTTISYCGIPEGRGFDEPNFGSAVIGSISKGKIKTERKQFAKRRYITKNLNVSQINSNAQIAFAAEEFIKESNYGKETALCLILQGLVDMDFLPDLQEITDHLNKNSEKDNDRPFLLKLKNETLPVYNAEALASDMTLRGELYRVLLPKINSMSIEEKLTAAHALQIGLSAIDGNPLI